MPSYLYKAKKESAETVLGQISAESQEQALELIHQLGLLPVSIEENTAGGHIAGEIKNTRVKSKETYLFSRQLANLIKSGVPLLQALEIIGSQMKSTLFGRVIEDIMTGVRHGRSFSSCLGDYPKIFSTLYVAMVRAGEESGKLKEMLLRMAEHQKSQEEIASKVRSAMTYPAFMLVIGTATVIFILTFVMPKLSGLFADLGRDLPWPTVVVLKMSAVMRTSGVWGVAAFAFLLLALAQWAKTQAGRVVVSQAVLGVPFLRTFFLKMDLARFCRTLALLLKSGLPIIRAIEIAVPTLNNNFVKRDILQCVQGLAAGQTLGACLKQSALIPDMMSQLIAVGEESGSLTEALSDIADNYEQDIAESTKFMTTLLEPVMILSVGLVIGFIVFAMLLPIFQMDLLAH
jgi:type II secretory pathway component PulF